MIGLRVLNFNSIKQAFFDKAKVLAAVNDATRSNLSRIGSYVSRVAKNLIRSRKTISKPGQPPSSHTGILKRFLFFSYDGESRSVVIGPARTNQVFFDRHRRPVKGTVPEALEYGGDITIFEARSPISGRWFRVDLRNRRGGSAETIAEVSRTNETRYRTAHIRPRPYMGPAYENSQSKIAEIWRNSVRAKSA